MQEREGRRALFGYVRCFNEPVVCMCLSLSSPFFSRPVPRFFLSRLFREEERS